jgi:hypothetical protein
LRLPAGVISDADLVVRGVGMLKRYALLVTHGDGQFDPDGYGEAGLYVYRTVRDANAPGTFVFWNNWTR